MPSVVIPVRARDFSFHRRASLAGLFLANFLLFALLVKTGSLFGPSIDDLAKWWHDLMPAGAGLALAGVVNGLLSSEAKARLVFWRWTYPLPGSFAFSWYAQRDPRIDLAALRRIVGEWPADPREQNVVWFRLYRSVQNEPAVMHAHSHFLIARDYAALAVLMLPILGLAGLWSMNSTATAGIYAGLLLLQYLIARVAAKNHGISLVTNVLAAKASH